MTNLSHPMVDTVDQCKSEGDCVRLTHQSPSYSPSPPHTHTLFASRESVKDWQALITPYADSLPRPGAQL